MEKKAVERGQIEKELLEKHQVIIGIDEVGRGCLAGPIYAASVQLDYEKLFALDEKDRNLIRDSKKLSHKQRQKIIPVILEISLQAHICSSSVREIESIGIVGANFRAMRRSIRLCTEQPDIIILDGNARLPRYKGPQKVVVGGDSLCYSIAAASILAKEARDSYMRKQGLKYPEYDFDSNMGYGTKAHLTGISDHGICPLHRKNFGPVTRYIQEHGLESTR